MSELKRPYADRIRQERIRLGLAQSQLALAGNISKATQVAYESDLHVPSLEYLNAIGTLGIDTVFVLTGSFRGQFVEGEFDWDLLGNILDAIVNWSEEQNRQIPPEKLHDLIRMLYRDFYVTRVIDDVVMARALRLAA
jgi:transcriptional regulator with XRE-family HTH domain